MSNKSYRIQTTPGGSDKYLKIKLDQEIDHFEILSLKLSQKDLYGSYNSDFGVLIGRVIANGGVGVPNAKISIFIPITDDDKMNSAIVAAYPYSTPRDKNTTGVRYNLLPRVSVNNPFNIPGEYTPKVPVGSFPTKEEVTTNETLMEVFDKYYKYTTVTNPSGDYMIYGVPVGIQTVHMSVDITDIGKFSMNPASMVSLLGYSPNLFTEDGTRIKFSTDIETLPNVETQEISVDVKPFWGDSANFEIGITRQDFKIRSILAGSVVVFGSTFTDGPASTWGQNDFAGGDQDREMWRVNNDGVTNISIGDKRIGKLNPVVAYYPATVTDTSINSGSVNTSTDIKIMDSSEYIFHNEDGRFIFIIPCNRRKIVTGDDGQEVVVDNSEPNGIYSEFRGMIFFQYDDQLSVPNFDQISGGKFDGHTFWSQRWKCKVPQSASINQCLNQSVESYNEAWRKQSATMGYGRYYSVAKFHPLSYADTPEMTGNPIMNDPGLDPFWNTGVIWTTDDALGSNSSFQFPRNGTNAFGGEWINFCLYFPQHTFFIRDQENERHSNNNPTYNNGTRYYFNPNTQKLVGNLINTQNYLRNDFHQTAFIEVPKDDVLNIVNQTLSNNTPLGFKNTDAPYSTTPLIGTQYKGNGSTKYFYKGLGSGADIFRLLRNKNLV